MVVPACAGQREQSRPGSLMHAGAGAGAVIVAAKAAEERTGASPTRRIPASKRRRGRWALLAVLVLSSCSDGFAFAPQVRLVETHTYTYTGILVVSLCTVYTYIPY